MVICRVTQGSAAENEPQDNATTLRHQPPNLLRQSPPLLRRLPLHRNRFRARNHLANANHPPPESHSRSPLLGLIVAFPRQTRPISIRPMPTYIE